MTEQIPIRKNKPDHLKLSKQARRIHVKACQEGNQSVASYCRDHHIPESTFYKWLKIYAKETSTTGSFIPLPLPVIKEESIAKPVLKQELHITVSSGVTLIIPELIDTHAIAKLIKAIASCN
jgi:transposase-like protein